MKGRLSMEITDLIGILVEQNKSFIEQNKNYKDMLVFAVGSIITILVIFLTANFFTMRKIRQDEIERIKTEVIQSLKENSLSDIRQELDNNLESLVKEKLSLLETKITQVKFHLEMSKSDTKGYFEVLKREQLELQGLLYMQKGNLEEVEEYYSNAFVSYLKAGNTFVKAGQFRLGHIDQILRLLEKTALEIDTIGTELTDFKRFANQLEEEYQPKVNRILDILTAKILL